MPTKPKGIKAKLGIFMPCYNLDQYIDEALESLYAQTSQDFYLIIADDASTKSSVKPKLEAIDYPRCEINFETTNLGLIPICNKYMSKLETEYIMLFSPDDIMEPTFVEESIKYLDTHPHKAAVCTYMQQFGDYSDLIKYSEKTCRLPNMLVENNYSGAAVVRKSAWEKAGKHDTNPNLFPNLDYDLWLCMLARGYSLGVIKKPLFKWRALNSSLGHDVSFERRYTFKHALLHKHADLYSKYAEFVIEDQLSRLRKLELDYLEYEKGHIWLDSEYRRLSAENKRLTTRLHDYILLPHSRKLKNVLRRIKKSI